MRHVESVPGQGKIRCNLSPNFITSVRGVEREALDVPFSILYLDPMYSLMGLVDHISRPRRHLLSATATCKAWQSVSRVQRSTRDGPRRSMEESKKWGSQDVKSWKDLFLGVITDRLRPASLVSFLALTLRCAEP